MALDFPATPALNETYTSQGVTFRWNGTVWLMLAAAFPFATTPEALAGTAADKVMSPATSKAVLDARPGGGSPFDGTPTNVRASRFVSTVYQNTLDRPMAVAVGGNSNIEVFAQEATAAPLTQSLTRRNRADNVIPENGVFVLIPRGWYYSVTALSGEASILTWVEWR